MIADPRIIIPCHICHKPVQLEKAVSDEDGRTVHPDCYVRVIYPGVHEVDSSLAETAERRWPCQL